MASNGKKSLYEGPTAVSAPLTPMIDVVFLLIIFFLFGQFRKLEGEFIARLPQHPGIVAAPEKLERMAPGQVLIKLTTKGEQTVYKMDDRVFREKEELQKALADVAAKTGGEDGMIYIIDFDDAVRVGETIGVYDYLLTLGVKDVSFAPPAK